MRADHSSRGVLPGVVCLNVIGHNNNLLHLQTVGRYAVAQLVEALRYKPEGRGFDSRWCHWNFSLA
jgi:hypothetical protein